MDSAIETTRLTKTFGTHVAVNGIDVHVPRGAFYGFLGPNGAGKSTTIKMLTGLMAPTSGDVHVLGLNLIRDPLAVKRRIGVLPEDLCLFENLTAREYLTFIGRMYGLPSNVLDERCGELITLMDLADQEKTLTLEYSHGMKKKLSLAAALIHDPELLFLDEPFEGIDPIASRTLRTVLERFVERGSTIFITSHILEIVEKLCTHVGIINEGHLVKQASKAELSVRGSLERTFIEVVGDVGRGDSALSWLGSTS